MHAYSRLRLPTLSNMCYSLRKFFYSSRMKDKKEEPGVQWRTHSEAETEQAGAELAVRLRPGTVVAMYGGLGMGKTAFVRGMAAGLGLSAEVSSPTFALVHEYGGRPPLVHFDMYRVSGWEDVYATGFFEYIDGGAILAVEWSENIEGALPPGTLRVRFERLGETDRLITAECGNRTEEGTRI